jgi:hypothetical protein
LVGLISQSLLGSLEKIFRPEIQQDQENDKNHQRKTDLGFVAKMEEVSCFQLQPPKRDMKLGILASYELSAEKREVVNSGILLCKIKSIAQEGLDIKRDQSITKEHGDDGS